MRFAGLVFLLMFVFQVKGQDNVIDTLSPKKDTVHSVKKAVLFSAIIPGAGQVYNHIAMPPGKKRAYWKVPLIYAGLGVTGYYMIQNNSLQKSLKREYLARQGSDFTQTFDPQWEQYDSDGILTLYDQHLNRRDLFIIAFGLVYILQVADAAVEAHFVNFDISEDLSMNISPTMMSLHDPGVKLTFKFR